MKKLIILFAILCQAFVSYSQIITWSKYFDPSVDGEIVNALYPDNNSFILGTNIFCSGTAWTGCLYISKLDSLGEIVIDTIYNTDEKFSSLVIRSTNKSYTKYNNQHILPLVLWNFIENIPFPALGIVDKHLKLKKLCLYKSLDTSEMIQMNSVENYGKNYLTINTSFYNKIDSQEVRPVLVLFDDTLGQIAQRKVKGLEDYRILDNPNFKKLSDGTIACATNVRLYGEGLTDDRHIALFRFDTTGNVIWKKIINKSAWGDKHFYNTDIDQLPNGNIVFNGAEYIDIDNWNGLEDPYYNYVQCNTISGDSLWRHSFRSNDYARKIGVLNVMPNGNIIGGGIASCNDCYPGLPGSIFKSWLFCLSPSGKLLWERYYKNPNEPVDVSYFRKIVTCTDGGILVGTEGRETEQTTGGLWLLKLDSMGCMTPDCSGTELYTAVKDEKGAWQNLKEVFFRIYPNPVGNILTVDFFSPQPGRKMELMLSDMQGILIQKKSLPNDKHQEQIDVSGLKPGSYTLSLLMNGKIIQSEVVVKE